MDRNQVINDFLTTLIAPVVKEAVREELARHAHLSDNQNLEDEFLNAKESAEFIGDALQTFYGRTSKGEISTYGSGKRIFCKKSELMAWKEKQRTKPKEAVEQEVDSYLVSKRRTKQQKPSKSR